MGRERTGEYICDQHERKTPQNGSFIFALLYYPFNLNFFVLFSNYELKTNESNINSFNFSTSLRAIKRDILLARPHFY